MKHASKVLAFGDFKNHRTPVRFSSTNNIINEFSIEPGSSGVISNNLFLGNSLYFESSSSFEIKKISS